MSYDTSSEFEFGLQGTVLRASDNSLRTMRYRAEQIESQLHRMFCTPAFARIADQTNLLALTAAIETAR